MKFYQYLYWADDVHEKKRNRIKWYLKVHKKSLHVYVLTLATNSDQLEIIDSILLLQDFYRRNPPFVIGISNSYQGALQIVEKIAKECYTETKTGNIKQYLANRK